MRKVVLITLAFLVLALPVSAARWHTLPGTLATIDTIEAGYVRFEIAVPDGVHFIHLPENLFDYPVKEGDQFILRFIEHEEPNRREQLQGRINRLMNR